MIAANDNVKLMQGDCLELMRNLPDASVDMILCDLPYGTTQNKWDSVIPLDALWAEYRRISRGAIVLTAAQPFTSVLVGSNLAQFKYTWVWQKSRPTGHMNAKKQPLREHEDVCVFYARQPTYNPQFTKGKPNHVSKNAQPRVKSHSSNYGAQYEVVEELTDRKYPKTILPFTVVSPTDILHPTQKPVALMEYLVRTYTNEGDTVLDNCMGSGTTGVACMNTGRRFIGMEMDAGYFEIARGRIHQALTADNDNTPSAQTKTA